jgi:hypothetical protein
MTPKQQKRLLDLHARVIGGSTPEAREDARGKLGEFLTNLGKNWNDLAALIAEAQPAPAFVDPRDAEPPSKKYSNVTPADLVDRMLEQYLAVKAHERVAITLWVLHSHVYDRFMVTPRLVLCSPVRNCGKTTVLDVAERLVARPKKSDNISAAAVYHLINTERRTFLLDEGDNLELTTAESAALRAALNGNRKGSTIDRMARGRSQAYSAFAPIAVAVIGDLPLPLVSRSIVIPMERGVPKRRFDHDDTEDLDLVYRHILMWAREARLNLNPKMPPEVRGRDADNWRPLIAIADACSSAWGTRAREAAIAFCRGRQDEDPGVLLLCDIREIFNRGADQLASKVLVDALNAMDDAPWSEWRGVRGDQQMGPLSPTQFAGLLAPFGIRSRVLWPSSQRARGSGSFRGYRREWFEAAWRAYCGSEASQASPPKLKLVKD